MKPKEWGIFLGGHHFRLSECNIEFDKKKFNIDPLINGMPASQDKRWEFFVAQIGVISMQSPSKIVLQKDTNGLLITPPPHFNGLGIKTQSFQRMAEQFVWNYIIENDTDDKDTLLSSLLSSPSSFSSSSPSLWSLLPSSTTSITLLSLPPPAPANKKRKLNKGASNDYVSSNDDYPQLSCALGKEDGFNPADPTIQKIMRALLAESIGLLSKDYELNLIDSANNSVSYVRVPKTSSNQSFQNTKEWLDVAIKIAGSKHGGTFKSAYHITNHLIRLY
jgi:hypothetical protein